MKHSWWKTTMVLLCAILLCISALFVCTSFNIRRQVRQTVEETNANALEFWSSNTENRLSMLYEHVYELLVSLYNNTELRTGTPLMDINTKRLIIDLMNDKMMVSADADALFVLDTDSDFYLYSSSTSLSAKERIALKQKCREAAQINPQALADRRWSTLNVDGENYFFKNFRLGKYIVGAVSRTERFSPEDMVTILGREPVFVLWSVPTGPSAGWRRRIGRSSRTDARFVCVFIICRGKLSCLWCRSWEINLMRSRC